MSEPDTPRDTSAGDDFDEHVSEIASPTAGAASPFGNVEFPLPLDATGYVHPGRHERPHLPSR